MSENKESTTYWKSLNQLANNEEYRNFLEREFPENASEFTDGMSRKNFLRIMGASIALAGFAACRRPVEKILPYKIRPKNMVPGNPLFYSSAMPYRGALTGLVVTTREGRPIKIEGNEQHPASMGKTNTQQQGAILGLYDPDRSRSVINGNAKKTWNDFLAFTNTNLTPDKKIAFLSEASSSMTLDRLKKDALKKFKNSVWVTYEPFGEYNTVNGNAIAFGKKLRTFNNFDKASVIVSLDSDFLGQGAENVINMWNFSRRRELKNSKGELNRLYVVENNHTLTGSNADNRLRIKSQDIEPFTYALAASLSKKVSGLEAFSNYTNKYSDHSWVSSLTEQLVNHKGECVVVAGNDRSEAMAATVAAINLALGNNGKTVSYYEVPTFDDGDENQAFVKLAGDLKSGKYDALVMIGTNPVLTAPADLDFKSALKATKTTIQLSEYHDETARNVTWHVNRAHFLETWGDGMAFMGDKSVVQPMIQPLFGGKSEIEFLNAIVTGKEASAYDLVRETWKSYLPKNNYEDSWQVVLVNGVLADSGFKPAKIRLDRNFSSSISNSLKGAKTADPNNIEIVVKPDNKILDGRYANIAWLQELPDPITKITWDNAALMSLKTAAGLKLQNQDLIKIDVDGKSILLAAWIVPGHADNSITVWTGYGRHGIGRIADHTYGETWLHVPKDPNNHNADVFPLVTTTNPLYHESVKITKTGELYPIANTQDHGSMEGRPLIREATLDEYRKNPNFAPEMVENPDETEKLSYRKGGVTTFTPPMFDEQKYPDYEPQWGMSIDLTTCVGCGVCTIACQAENNIPVVGKTEVRKGREMHWIRTDRYFVGDDTDNPKIAHQPIPCMQCELAPCEEVCPVAATTHSDDGINQMTYNRCIGTRYCLNNCPYKVRRFNFFNYGREFLTTGDDPDIIQMAMNPDVTVRFRGVMEKCSYCVQRINRAKIETQNKTGDSIKPPDGMVKTACQQACPTNAIWFGDVSDPKSRVVEIKKNERNYLLLSSLNTRPRTSYLGKVRNPDDKLEQV